MVGTEETFVYWENEVKKKGEDEIAGFTVGFFVCVIIVLLCVVIWRNLKKRKGKKKKKRKKARYSYHHIVPYLAVAEHSRVYFAGGE